jgi:hypothetical protein
MVGALDREIQVNIDVQNASYAINFNWVIYNVLLVKKT